MFFFLKKLLFSLLWLLGDDEDEKELTDDVEVERDEERFFLTFKLLVG